MRLGLIAGKGDIPRLIAENKRQAGEPIFVVGIKGQDEAWIQEFPHKICGIAEAGNVIRALKSAECDTVSMIGNITRPDFTRLKPDLKAVSILPRLVKAATKGDDSLLRVLVEMFEEEGFDVVGAETLLSNLKGESGLLSQCAPSETDIADIRKCYDVAGEIGRLDIGQGAVVARGLVLAVEAQEGTDEMLRRVAKLPEAIRGTEDQRCGVLVKRPNLLFQRRNLM